MKLTDLSFGWIDLILVAVLAFSFGVATMDLVKVGPLEKQVYNDRVRISMLMGDKETCAGNLAIANAAIAVGVNQTMKTLYLYMPDLMLETCLQAACADGVELFEGLQSHACIMKNESLNFSEFRRLCEKDCQQQYQESKVTMAGLYRDFERDMAGDDDGKN